MTKTTEQKVFRFIDENHLIENGDKILVALSGGADSIFLLYFLLKFQRRFGIEVSAFHLNHKLRGKFADQDEKFCIDFCLTNNIKLIRVAKNVSTISRKMKVSIEEAGRETRYSELNRAAKQNGLNKIATAHNASDNVETILLNLFKGTGVKGLAGIPFKRDNIIRPILCLNSEEIRKYLKENKIPFRVDETNLNSDYERNFLRNEIIPKLKQRLNPKLEEKIIGTSKIISGINSFIEMQVKQISEKTVKNEKGKLTLNLNELKKVDKSLLNILLKSIIENNFDIELSTENIFSLSDLVDFQTGSKIHLKENIIALKERNEILIWKKSFTRKEKSSHKIKVGHKVILDGKIISISKVNRKMFKFTQNKSVEFISGDGLKNNFEIRKWKAGDKFHPIGMKGNKKISDFLTDIKISSNEKEEDLLLTNSGKIVWVIGHRIDERFKITSETEIILKLSVTKK